jgi:hypothetical protein
VTFKVGDKVKYIGDCYVFSGFDGGVDPAEGVVTEDSSKGVTQLRLTTGVGRYRVGQEVRLITKNLELIKEELPNPWAPKPAFTFKDIQVGDKIRRTETWETGTYRTFEGVVTDLTSTGARTKEGLLVGYYKDIESPHMKLELLDRPKPKEIWENRKAGDKIKRKQCGGWDYFIKEESGWTILYSGGQHLKYNDTDVAALLKGNETVALIK